MPAKASGSKGFAPHSRASCSIVFPGIAPATWPLPPATRLRGLRGERCSLVFKFHHPQKHIISAVHDFVALFPPPAE